MTSKEISLGIFHANHYLRHNDKRLQHLDSLRILQPGMTVLETGAGIGDHTVHLLSKGCVVTATEARPENLAVLQERFPNITTKLLDLDNPDESFASGFDVVYCYGTLYHLSKPTIAIEFMARRGKIILLETWVSFGNDLKVLFCNEDNNEWSQSFSGTGCRPTRAWVFNELKKYYQFVYISKKQPNHEEFPLDWTKEIHCSRAVFIASTRHLENDQLMDILPDKQEAI